MLSVLWRLYFSVFPVFWLTPSLFSGVLVDFTSLLGVKQSPDLQAEAEVPTVAVKRCYWWKNEKEPQAKNEWMNHRINWEKIFHNKQANGKKLLEDLQRKNPARFTWNKPLWTHTNKNHNDRDAQRKQLDTDILVNGVQRSWSYIHALIGWLSGVPRTVRKTRSKHSSNTGNRTTTAKNKSTRNVTLFWNC